VVLKRSQLDQIIAQARRDSPDETCGMIGGIDGRPLKLYPIANAAPAEVRNVRYLMEPLQQLAALNDMDEQGYELVSIYHSHPAVAPYFSSTDKRIAYVPDTDEPMWPGVTYLIVSLLDPASPQVRGYRPLNGGIVADEPIEVEYG
jgi:proteasome lid subunit RPN8/RPN11